MKAAIVQDVRDNRVLMLAWMDEEAERLTRETGEAWFWSRSRQRLWKKGETSGNTLEVEEIREDCDDDTLLLRVTPAGPTCHTGSRSCFAPELWRTVVERVRERPAGSYVASLANEGVARAARPLLCRGGDPPAAAFARVALRVCAQRPLERLSRVRRRSRPDRDPRRQRDRRHARSGGVARLHPHDGRRARMDGGAIRHRDAGRDPLDG